jgi:molybdenum cofactor cytidylyltransferase
MAPRNKLLLRDETGLTMVGRVVRACCGSRLVDQILLVTGHEAPDVGRAARDAAAGRALRVVHTDNYRLGMSASLRAGLTALPDHAEAALICLGDMPLVSSQIIDQVIGAYNASAGGLIVAPTSGGRRGNPVLWDRRFFPEMDSLRGDTGARALLKQHEAHLVEIEVGDECVLRDFDTPAALMAGFDRHRE